MIGQVSASRPNYYDRTLAIATASYLAEGLAPHADTQRWSYTVPSGKKAYLQALTCMMHRDIAAAPAARAIVFARYTPSGGSATYLAVVKELQNALGIPHSSSFAGTGVMRAGDVLISETGDGSTGGAYTFLSAAWLAEFDA